MSPGPILKLTPEVLLALADYLPEAALNALAKTCHELSPIFNNELYSRNSRLHNSIALLWGVYHDKVGTVKKALESGADPDCRRLCGRIRRYNPRLYAYKDLDSEEKNIFGTALTMAAKFDRVDIAKLLIEAGASVDPGPESYNAPLLVAVREDHMAMTKYLIETGKVHVDSLARYEINLLSEAVRCSSIELIGYILERVKDAEVHSGANDSPLLTAVVRQRLDMVKLLLESGKVNPGLVDDKLGRSTLAWAAYLEDPTGSIFPWLLNLGGIDPNLTDNSGNTALSLAAKAGKQPFVSLLLAKQDVDPNIADRKGLTPIFHGLKHEQITDMFIKCERVSLRFDALFRDACRRASTATVKQILEASLEHHGTDHLTIDKRGKTWLHVAATGGHADVVERLLELTKQYLNKRQFDGLTPLLCALSADKSAAATALLRANADVTITGPQGRSALFYAAESGSSAMMEELIRRGCAVSAVTSDGQTALHSACEGGNLEAVQILLANGADPVQRADNAVGESPLHAACSGGYERIVQILLQKIPRAHPILLTGYTPLHDACWFRHAPIVKLLLDHEADLRAKDDDGDTPLIKAAFDLTTTKLLLEHGADAKQMGSSGETLLHEVCERGKADLACLLLKHGARPNTVARDGASPLLVACARDDVGLVTVLLEHGADPDAAFGNGLYPPLHGACSRGRVGIASVLLKHAADPNAALSNGETPLYLACERGHVGIASLLLKHGVNPNAALSMDATLLHGACVRGYFDIASVLLEHGADPNAALSNGVTALHGACARNSVSIASLLLKHDADPNAALMGVTALHSACACGYFGIASLLLEHRADPNAAALSNGVTPLHVACDLKTDTRLVRLLLDNGARVTAVAAGGITPLYFACSPRRGAPDFVGPIRALLERGADVHAVTTDGLTPLHAACMDSTSSHETIELLLARGANALAEYAVSGYPWRCLTPIHLACYERSETKGLALLLQSVGRRRCAEVWADGTTPLHVVVEKRNSEAVRLLLSHGVNPNAASPENGQTALHWLLATARFTCVTRGAWVLSELLSADDIDVNQRDSQGRTALGCAASSAPGGLREMLRLLEAMSIIVMRRREKGLID